MTEKPKKATAKKKTAGAAPSQPGDRVAAETLVVGDEIFFPNSRQAQKIESIVDDPGNESISATRRLISGDTTWTVQPNFEIRKG